MAAEIHQVSPDSSDISFDLWLEGTRMSAPPTPRLSLEFQGTDLLLFWPNDLTGFILESTSQLIPNSWTPVDGIEGNQLQVDPTGETQFYRLRRL